MDPVNLIFAISILIVSVIAHELSHGYAAEFLGDPTARLAGRLTINPLKHLDPVGSLAVPLASFILGGFIFGWAKPVPYNPYNLKKGRFSETIVSGAGVFTNLALALIFSMVIRFGAGTLPASFLDLAGFIVLINIVLAIFNLIPVPPLDGSKILFSLLPYRFNNLENFFERWSLPILIFIVIFFWQFLTPVISLIYRIFTGTSY